MESFFGQFVGQMVSQAPQILVYLGALICAIVLWGRSPAPAALTLIGAIVLLIAAILHPFLNSLFFQRVLEGDWPHERYGSVNAILAIVFSALRAIAFAMVVIAVFIGRGRRAP
ncbi:MAG: hypothetical protein U0793_21740 [Gemmataceae bacterium]